MMASGLKVEVLEVPPSELSMTIRLVFGFLHFTDASTCPFCNLDIYIISPLVLKTDFITPLVYS